MAAPVEQRTFQAAEVKLTRDVTPREIAERTGGSMSFAGGCPFVTVIAYEHTEGLQILTERLHEGAREHLSLLRLPVVKVEETSVETFLLGDTDTILRPDSVTFLIPVRRKGEESQSPNSEVEVTISKEGFSYFTRVEDGSW